MSKIKLATVWLDGCSGCHMSFLDMDERLIDLSSQFDLVFSPIVDFKVFPENVDIALVGERFQATRMSTRSATSANTPRC
jgi:NAD-reducing hydrogenase small subunit